MLEVNVTKERGRCPLQVSQMVVLLEEGRGMMDA